MQYSHSQGGDIMVHFIGGSQGLWSQLRSLSWSVVERVARGENLGVDRIQPLRKRIAQLETEVRALRKRDQIQRQRLAHKYGREFLALLDSDRNFKVFVTDIVQKLVFQDEDGSVISETDSSLVGKIIEVRFNSVH